jgi:hypothetical protein
LPADSGVLHAQSHTIQAALTRVAWGSSHGTSHKLYTAKPLPQLLYTSEMFSGGHPWRPLTGGKYRGHVTRDSTCRQAFWTRSGVCGHHTWDHLCSALCIHPSKHVHAPQQQHRCGNGRAKFSNFTQICESTDASSRLHLITTLLHLVIGH